MIPTYVSQNQAVGVNDQSMVASLERQRMQLTTDIRQACNEFLNESDWDKNLAIVDQLNRMTYLCPLAIKEIRTLLKTKNPEIEILALVLTETIVKNCPVVHASVAQPEFMRYLVKVALNQRKDGKFKAIGKKLTFKKTTVIDSVHKRSECIDKALLLLQMLASAYDKSNLYPIYKQTYLKLQSQGVRFPKPNKDEDLQIFTPIHDGGDQIDANSNQNHDKAASSAMGSIPGLHLLPMIRPISPLADVTHPQLVSAQDTAQILWEIINSCEDGDRMIGNEIVHTLVETLEAQQQTLVMMASDSTCTEAALMQSLQINDIANSVLSDVRSIRNGTKRRYRRETKLIHIFPEHQHQHQANESGSIINDNDDLVDKNNDFELPKPVAKYKRDSPKTQSKKTDTSNDNDNDNDEAKDAAHGNNNTVDLLDFLGDDANKKKQPEKINALVQKPTNNVSNDKVAVADVQSATLINPFEMLEDPFPDNNNNTKNASEDPFQFLDELQNAKDDEKPFIVDSNPFDDLI